MAVDCILKKRLLKKGLYFWTIGTKISKIVEEFKYLQKKRK